MVDYENNPLWYLVKKYPEKIWDMNSLASNPNTTMDIINDNNCFDTYFLSSNPNINLKYLKKNIHQKWNWSNITMNKAFTWDIIQNNSDLPWDYRWFSWNQNITWEIVCSKPDDYWDWHGLSYILPINIIEDNISKNWNWYGISRNKSIDLKFAKKYTSKLDWFHVSSSPRITINDIENNDDLPWDWDGISSNPNINLDFIKKWKNIKHFNFLLLLENVFLDDIEFGHHFLSKNPNITIQYIENNIDKISFRKLSENIFSLENSKPYKYSKFRLNKSKYNLFEVYGEELFKNVCHPDRYFDWCLDNEK